MHERLLTKYFREIDSVINRGYYRKALAYKRIEDSDKRYNLMLMNPFTFCRAKKGNDY
jgi:hypothetical protein